MQLSDLNPLTWLKASNPETEMQSLTATGAVVEIAAAEAGNAESKVRNFTSVAYTGGEMHFPAFPAPVVVDLSTLKFSAKTVPVFREHDPNRVVGQSQQVVNDKKELTVSGTIINSNEHAREVLEAAQNGFHWQQSIGVKYLRNHVRFIKAGEKLEANGRSFTGPLYFVLNAQLKEVSFVALGADENTSAELAATALPDPQKEPVMKFGEWLKANGWKINDLTQPQMKSLRAAWKSEHPEGEDDTPSPSVPAILNAAGTDGASADGLVELRADRVRMRKLETLHAKYSHVNEITLDDGKKVEPLAHSIEAGWQPNELEVYLLRAGYPKAPAGHVGQKLQGEQSQQVMEAAVLQATGYQQNDLEKEFDDKILQAAHTQFKGRLGLQELLLEAAYANGYHGRANFRSNRTEILQAAFSSNEISGILSNTANKYIRVAFENVESAWRKIAHIRSVSDFKTITTYSLTGDLAYERIGPTGEIKHGKVGEQSYSNKADTYAKLLTITREDQINDDMGALQVIPRRLGRGAGLAINQIFWPKFMDNAAFFTAERKNYFSGGDSALGVDSLTAAETLFLEQTDPDGNPLGESPAILLVPPGEKVNAELLMASLEVRGSSGKTPTKNPHAGKFSVVYSSYLSNAKYTGHSATAWYLLANPESLPVIEVVFLNGQQMPTIEQSETSFDTLGIQMRGYHDFGCEMQEYRGGVMSKGAA